MTILESMDRYYHRMARRGEASLPGYSREQIGFVIVLSLEGVPMAVQSLRTLVGKRVVAQMIDVPAPLVGRRTGGIMPNLFWDKSAYSLGVTEGEGKRTQAEHAAFSNANLDFIAGSTDVGLIAYRRFLQKWKPSHFATAPFMAEMLDANIVFKLENENGFLHQRKAAEVLLAERTGSSKASQMCLVTGVSSAVARLHPTIKRVYGAQPTGASLVSFNLDAFTSHGKLQGDNAPTSEAAAFRYGAALNRMLDYGSRNRLSYPLGDTTVVFWADVSATVDEQAAQDAELWFLTAMQRPDDEKQTKRLGAALADVASGTQSAAMRIVPDTQFYVLGLAPNVARLSVRYWLHGSINMFTERLAQHHEDLRIEPSPWGAYPPTVAKLLVRTSAPQQEYKNIPAQLAADVMRAALDGTPYPHTLLAATIMRLRAADNPGSGWHAAVIKACIARTNPKEPLPVSLDPDNPSTAYQLGRLFAVLESAQLIALGKVNGSIADRYYGAASATPARVFGSLLRGARHHISDANKRKKAPWLNWRIEQIMGSLPADLPLYLRLQDQGRFAVGYYHERAYRPAKKFEIEDSSPTEDRNAEQEAT